MFSGLPVSVHGLSNMPPLSVTKQLKKQQIILTFKNMCSKQYFFFFNQGDQIMKEYPNIYNKIETPIFDKRPSKTRKLKQDETNIYCGVQK